nr:uncharacterized protein LOC111511387 [Leptinotarsa decemlineata]
MAADDCGRNIKRELESVGDEVIFETNIMKCETGETEMVGESGKYDMFGIEMVTNNLEEKYDIDQINCESVIEESKSEKCIEEISGGPLNEFLDIQGEDMTHDSKPTTDFRSSTLLSCHSNVVSSANIVNDPRMSSLLRSFR